eukprot:5089272-Prymnesium_polylepis.2
MDEAREQRHGARTLKQTIVRCDTGTRQWKTGSRNAIKCIAIKCIAGAALVQCVDAGTRRITRRCASGRNTLRRGYRRIWGSQQGIWTSGAKARCQGWLRPERSMRSGGICATLLGYAAGGGTRSAFCVS